MKRSRHPSSSEDSDGSNSTSWSQHSQLRRANGMKHAELFRTDFITAMKLCDTYQLNPEDYYVLADPWRQEWEKGVQVPVSPHIIPEPVARVVAEKRTEVMFSKPKKWIRSGVSEALGYVDIQTLAEGTCRYDLNETDVAWLELVNHQFTQMGLAVLDETTMERAMEEFERCCYDRMSHAMATEEGLGMEYDEGVVCDTCRSPDSEEMVFCDKCNICVHQCSAKSCRTAFHVSCALQNNLEKNTIFKEFQSFCPKHSGLVGGEDKEKEGGGGGRVLPVPHLVPNSVEALNSRQEVVNLRHIKLQQLEEEFYQLVDIKEVSQALQLNQETVHFMYQYWKLKCRANHSQPLLTPQEEESLTRRKHDVLLHHLQQFTHRRLFPLDGSGCRAYTNHASQASHTRCGLFADCPQLRGEETNSIRSHERGG